MNYDSKENNVSNTSSLINQLCNTRVSNTFHIQPHSIFGINTYCPILNVKYSPSFFSVTKHFKINFVNCFYYNFWKTFTTSVGWTLLSLPEVPYAFGLFLQCMASSVQSRRSEFVLGLLFCQKYRLFAKIRKQMINGRFYQNKGRRWK